MATELNWGAGLRHRHGTCNDYAWSGRRRAMPGCSGGTSGSLQSGRWNTGMALFENLGSALRVRRRKTFADRVEAAAERAADAVRDAYAGARASLAPARRGPATRPIKPRR